VDASLAYGAAVSKLTSATKLTDNIYWLVKCNASVTKQNTQLAFLHTDDDRRNLTQSPILSCTWTSA